MKIEDVTVKNVWAAYRKIDYSPILGAYVSDAGCCPLSALYLASLPPDMFLSGLEKLRLLQSFKVLQLEMAAMLFGLSVAEVKHFTQMLDFGYITHGSSPASKAGSTIRHALISANFKIED